MADMHLLERTLAQNVSWNKARINFLAKFLIALVQVKTVNLTEIASVFAGRAQPESHYKRIQRFLRFFAVSYAWIALCVVRLVGVQRPGVLTLDRTDWQWGQTPLHILLLGLVSRGIAFPVLWTILDKKGNSNPAERIALWEQFLRIFGVEAIQYLCADREFIGKQWFAWLEAQRIDFRSRVRAPTQMPNRCGQMVPAWRVFRSLPPHRPLVLAHARTIWGQALSVSGMRLASGEYVIVVAPQYAATALEDYSRRWEIETLFSCLKSRGFCLEDTHVTHPARLKKLLAVLALAFCWAHVIGEWLTQQQPLQVKRHGRLAKSIFRHGFDHLRRILCNLTRAAQQRAFRQAIQLLSCT